MDDIPVFTSREFLKSMPNFYSTLIIMYLKNVIDEEVEESFEIAVQTCNFLPATGFTIVSSLDRELNPYCFPVNLEEFEKSLEVFACYMPERGLTLCLKTELLEHIN